MAKAKELGKVVKKHPSYLLETSEGLTVSGKFEIGDVLEMDMKTRVVYKVEKVKEKTQKEKLEDECKELGLETTGTNTELKKRIKDEKSRLAEIEDKKQKDLNAGNLGGEE